MPIPSVSLGQTALAISRIGLGAMPLAVHGRPDREQAIGVIHRALDLGVTLIDTADAYCQNEDDKHYGERLVAQALQTYRGSTDVTIATKGFVVLGVHSTRLFLSVSSRRSDSSRWRVGNRFNAVASPSSDSPKLRDSRRREAHSSLAIA